MSHNIEIRYGSNSVNIDVTEICYNKLLHNDTIIIPSDDNKRAIYFSDPIYGTFKKIFIIDKNHKIQEYDHNKVIEINIKTNEIIVFDNDISRIHHYLKIKYGNFSEELPEQLMSIKYLNGDDKVLEIGGNIGRNSLVIAYILKTKNNDNNLVVLESDTDTVKLLCENRDINGFKFHIEGSALSKRKLIQKGWNTVTSEVLLDGYKNVNIISVDALKKKYNIEFNTLVLDCEGAFYYILMDMPEILNGINLIIMENDYDNLDNKKYVDKILTNNNFYVDYVQSGGWGPCENNFFEVWRKLKKI